MVAMCVWEAVCNVPVFVVVSVVMVLVGLIDDDIVYVGACETADDWV